MENDLSDYPARLRASTEHPEVIYTRARGCHAVKRTSRAPAGKTKAMVMLEDDDGTYLIVEGEPKTRRHLSDRGGGAEDPE